MNISEIEKRRSFETGHSIKCKCGHSMFINNRYGRMICSHCKRWVYKSKEIEGKYRKDEFLKTLKREI